jgi:hypothetical protein
MLEVLESEARSPFGDYPPSPLNVFFEKRLQVAPYKETGATRVAPH